MQIMWNEQIQFKIQSNVLRNFISGTQNQEWIQSRPESNNPLVLVNISKMHTDQLYQKYQI